MCPTMKGTGVVPYGLTLVAESILKAEKKPVNAANLLAVKKRISKPVVVVPIGP